MTTFFEDCLRGEPLRVPGGDVYCGELTAIIERQHSPDHFIASGASLKSIS
jgi:hypothetical protein